MSPPRCCCRRFIRLHLRLDFTPDYFSPLTPPAFFAISCLDADVRQSEVAFG